MTEFTLLALVAAAAAFKIGAVVPGLVPATRYIFKSEGVPALYRNLPSRIDWYESSKRF